MTMDKQRLSAPRRIPRPARACGVIAAILATLAFALAPVAMAQQDNAPLRRGRGAGGQGRGFGFGAGGGAQQGPGPGRLGGGLGRRRGPGAQAMTLGRLLQVDAQLQNARQRFERIETRQGRLIDDLTQEKARSRPGAVDPASLLARQAVARLMAEAAQLTDEARQNSEEAGALIADMIAMRDLWQPAIERGGPLPGLDDAQSSATRTRWLDAARRSDAEGPLGFASALVGEAFAQAAIQAMPPPEANDPDLAQPAGDGRGRGPLGMRGRGGREMRALLEDRLARLEQRNADLARMLDQQRREIELLRSFLDGGNPPPPDRSPETAKPLSMQE
jgi:hypothetical protein